MLAAEAVQTKGLGVIVGARDIAVDGCHEVIDGAEHPTPQRLAGEPGG